ncbi:unnamed protein product [Spirodela intermedia]|uniref:Uncharacterized protein n=1 Tax=Spirodela intermedia TaxID=51605 RepID=A0A7I8IIK6_SPIIN|nr:unnamed protein product [Spirodela intermedia]CAA6657702.1 unnamed protein product [Spirodela intermedia]
MDGRVKLHSRPPPRGCSRRGGFPRHDTKERLLISGAGRRRGSLRRATGTGIGRRCLLSFLFASTPVLSDAGDSQRALLQKYLEKSKANKAKNDKERLDSYYRRNYKDYFELVEGSNQGKKDELLTESEKEIRRWLEKNR